MLPIKQNKKLMFLLCRKCGEDLNQDECNHNDNDRCLTGTWVVDEILKSIEMGYTILKVHEVWAFENVEQYNRDSKTGGLFTNMMNKFIKMKQSASGFPPRLAIHKS